MLEAVDTLDAEELKEMERQLCQTDLRYICKELGMKDWDVIHSDLQAFLKSSKSKCKLLLMPRGHLKTSVLTIGLSIQHVLNDPDTSILLANAVWDNARSFLSEIKEYLQNKSILPMLFGKFESEHWNQDEVTIRQREKANKTPTYSTAGADKALASQHYKIIFADDIVNRQTISTPEQRKKTKKYYSDLLDLLEPDGTLYIIGTRWHDDDLYGDLIETEKDKFDVYVRKAIEDEKVTFPKKFSLKILEDLKKSKGSYEFSCQYLNDPIPNEDRHFKLPVRYWNEIPYNGIHTITVDLAISEKTNADYTVVMDCVRTPEAQLLVVEYCRGHYNPLETIEKVFYLASKCNSEHVDVGIESIAYQKALIYLLDVENKKRGNKLKISELRPHADKFTRTIALQPLWESGNLLLKQGMIELEEELARFPVSKNDDLLDALAYQLVMPQGLARTNVFKSSFVPPKYQRVKTYVQAIGY